MQAKGVRKIAQRRVDGRDDRVTARAVGEDEVQAERMELRAFEVDLVCAGPETASVEKVKALEAYVAWLGGPPTKAKAGGVRRPRRKRVAASRSKAENAGSGSAGARPDPSQNRAVTTA